METPLESAYGRVPAGLYTVCVLRACLACVKSSSFNRAPPSAFIGRRFDHVSTARPAENLARFIARLLSVYAIVRHLCRPAWVTHTAFRRWINRSAAVQATQIDRRNVGRGLGVKVDRNSERGHFARYFWWLPGWGRQF